MFYRGDGLARFYEVASDGTFVALGTAFHPGHDYKQIKAVDFTPATPNDDVVWYHAGTNQLRASKYAVNGVAPLWDSQSTAGYGTTLTITTGRFPQ